MNFKIVKYNYTCPDCGTKFSSTTNLGNSPECPGCNGWLDDLKGAIEDVKLKTKLVDSLVVDVESYQGELISISLLAPDGKIRKIYVDDEDCWACGSMLGVLE